MPDAVEVVLRRLKADRRLATVGFGSSFLNSVGDVLEKHGFGATKVYLLDKAGRAGDRDPVASQAEVILQAVLPVLESEPAIVHRRTLGRYIIKTLETLKSREVGL